MSRVVGLLAVLALVVAACIGGTSLPSAPASVAPTSSAAATATPDPSQSAAPVSLTV